MIPGSAESPAATTVEQPKPAENGSSNPDIIDQWFYERTWRRTEPPEAVSSPQSCWIVFQDPCGLGVEISRRLQGRASEIVEVTPGEIFKRSRDAAYAIRPGMREDYDALFDDLASRNIVPEKIVHLWSVVGRGSQDSVADKIDHSFYSLLFLAQAIGERDLSRIDISIVSDRLYSVGGEAVLNPAAATLLGPARVIPKEMPDLTCRSIDIDLVADGCERSADHVAAELSAPLGEQVVAWRRGERWIECLNHIDIGDRSRPGGLRQHGVYLITGGLGELGLEIALDLASRFQAKLILLGRTPLPPQEEWEHAAEAAGTPERIKEVLRKLVEIVARGGEILTAFCDVCRRDDMRRTIDAALTKFGAINGVLHAAGVVNDSPLQLKSRESAARVLDPKINGTLVLHDVLTDALQGAKLDFFILFSSVSSLTAPPGQIDYAAANAFLDAFAASQNDNRVVAINWGPWRRVGMAVRTSLVHPLLGRRLFHTPNQIAYSAHLSTEKQWVLGEHRLKAGTSVFPGTAYLEMTRAALARGALDSCVEYHDVFFHTPLLAEPGETRESRVDLRRGTNGSFMFSVRSKDGDWVEHASGRIAQFPRGSARTPCNRADQLAVPSCAFFDSMMPVGPNKKSSSRSALDGAA